MSNIDKLASTLAVTLAAGLPASLATLTGITTSLGLPPFVSDLLALVFFLLLTGYWTVLAIKATKRQSSTGFVVNSPGDGGLRQRLGRAIPCATVALVFLSVTSWIGFPAATSFLSGGWRFCGTLVAPCGDSYCVALSDSRSRPVVSECLRASDSSGYIDYRPKNKATYRPETLRVQCPGSTLLEHRVPAAFLDGTCQGLLEAK